MDLSRKYAAASARVRLRLEALDQRLSQIVTFGPPADTLTLDPSGATPVLVAAQSDAGQTPRFPAARPTPVRLQPGRQVVGSAVHGDVIDPAPEGLTITFAKEAGVARNVTTTTDANVLRQECADNTNGSDNGLASQTVVAPPRLEPRPLQHQPRLMAPSNRRNTNRGAGTARLDVDRSRAGAGARRAAAGVDASPVRHEEVVTLPPDGAAGGVQADRRSRLLAPPLPRRRPVGGVGGAVELAAYRLGRFTRRPLGGPDWPRTAPSRTQRNAERSAIQELLALAPKRPVVLGTQTATWGWSVA